MGQDAFISYSHKNKQVADTIVASLEQGNIRCWYAPRNLSPGSSWSEEIMTAIESVRVFVVIITDESIPSQHVLNEIASAQNSGASIIPLILTKAPLSKSMKYYLNTVHWLDATEKPLSSCIEELKSRINQLLGRTSAASRSVPPSQPPQASRKTAKAGIGDAQQKKRTAEPIKKPAAVPEKYDWDDMPAAEHIGMDISDNCISWGTSINNGKTLATKSIPQSYTIITDKSRHLRISWHVRETLTYIRDKSRSGKAPSVCTLALPYLTYNEFAQFHSTASALGIRSASAIKRVSAAALAIADKYPGQYSDKPVLIIEYSGVSTEAAIVQLGPGIAEILAVVQRQTLKDCPLSLDLLLNDVFRALDKSGEKVISHAFISDILPSSLQSKLLHMFRITCTRIEPDIVLKGAILLSEIRSGVKTDLILSDATDFEICAGTTCLLADSTNFPASGAKEILYNTARKDHSIDIYIRKNNMFLDQPISFKLSVLDVLDPKSSLKSQKLSVSVQIDNEGKLSFLIRNAYSGKEKQYPWREIRELLLTPEIG